MTNLQELLDNFASRAESRLDRSFIARTALYARIDFVSNCIQNRSGVRLLMSAMLAKIDRPDVDPRKPYTKINTSDSYSGRTYDEEYITAFISQHELPCNNTTAFLTPTLRNHDTPLTTATNLVGRPPRVYSDAIRILDDVAQGHADAESVLLEIIRHLLLNRNARRGRMQELLACTQSEDALPLSSERIIKLLKQHLDCQNSSRLPVIMVAAAYSAAESRLGERAKPLRGHNAADRQTGAMGDVEVCLITNEDVVTVYEMKCRRVTRDDIDSAVNKFVDGDTHLDNYVFITTEAIEPTVAEHAADMYLQTSGTEIAVLDCIGFLRHFLHLFHRLRTSFLDEYQRMMLAEPASAVSQPLKEAFLALRRAAEADE